MEGQIRIWAIHDGRDGHARQARGLAEALARRRPAEIVEMSVRPKAWAARLPARLWHIGGSRPGGWPFSGYTGGIAAIGPPWPELAIGAGRRVAPLLAALKARHGVRAVQLLDPKLPPGAFDLVAAPGHDRLGGPNVVATLGVLNPLTPASVAAAAKTWRPRLAHLPEPRVAVMLGGPSRSAFWSEDDVDRFVVEIAALSRGGTGVMLTASARSDPAVMAALRADCDRSASFLWSGEWGEAGENPYPAILGLAEAAIVSEDSVSMASEAATAGLPLHVFRIAGLSDRLRAFHRQLAAQGIARDFIGPLERWSYPPLAEADRAAAEVERRLLATP
jgi:mitochondrial fission protein ELM1